MTADRAFPIIAAVDVGSNSVKMTVARADGAGGLEELETASETVRLGEKVATTGILGADRVEAAMATLRQFAEVARHLGAVRLVGVATEATRQASNGPDFLARIRDDIGWDIRAISGDEEAQLTFRGLARGLDLAGSVVVADIGGGSTEVIVALNGVVTQSQSLRLGSGVLTERLVNSDPPTANEIAACIAAATDKLANLSLPTPRSARFVTLGGTGEYLARLVDRPSQIGPADLAAALRQCQAVTSHQLGIMIDAQTARARVLPAGLAIVQALANRLRPESIEIARSGIRVGLILAALDELTSGEQETA